ncbi:hypothetical protein GGR54DRAFT_635809 [Hypoxylon sp. NC1633]|nr:hypothetical protein GGR54DRAFT_635809 [Hypoxylon sp. NC1633]
MSATETLTEAPSTKGTLYMWNGTKDGKDGIVNLSKGSTNVLPYKMVNVTVQDMRSLSPRPTVITHGYEFLNAPTAVPKEVFMTASKSRENEKVLEEAYFDECCNLVKKVTGAAEAFTFVARIRSQNTDVTEAVDFLKQNRHGGTVPAAHVDRDLETAPQRLRSSLGVEKANELMAKYKRWACVNVWRPINTTVKRWPLCLVDHSAVPDWHYDTHIGRIYIAEDELIDIRGAKSYEAILKYDPRYEYHYASDMSPDEVLLFCAFHSDPHLGIPHCAFWDSKTTKDAPDRMSVEVRTWVFFED